MKLKQFIKKWYQSQSGTIAKPRTSQSQSVIVHRNFFFKISNWAFLFQIKTILSELNLVTCFSDIFHVIKINETIYQKMGLA